MNDIMNKRQLKIKPVTRKNKQNYIDCDAYETTEDYLYIYKKNFIIIPEGFQFDGASIPSIFWRMMGTPFTPNYIEAAAIHDWLYHTHSYTPANNGQIVKSDKKIDLEDWKVERNEADKIFLEMLRIKGKVGWLKRKALYHAVDVAGGLFWNEKKLSKGKAKTLKKLKEHIHDDKNYSIRRYGMEYAFIHLM